MTLGGTPITDLAGNSVTAGAAGTFSVQLTNTLVVTSQPPSQVSAGKPFGLIVLLKNVQGAVQTSFNGPVTVALASGPTGGSLKGTLTVDAVAGKATFSNLAIDKAGSGYTIHVNSSGLTSATTTATNVTPAAASQLIVTAQPPSSVTAGSSFGLTVTAEDPYDNVATAFAGSVAIALKSNPGAATLHGTLTIHAAAGVARFSGLTLDIAANGYTIQASTSGLPSVTTKSFDVTLPGAAPMFVIGTLPAGVGTGTSSGPNVAVGDRHGNAVKASIDSVIVSLKNHSRRTPFTRTRKASATSSLAAFIGLSSAKANHRHKLEKSGRDLPSPTFPD